VDTLLGLVRRTPLIVAIFATAACSGAGGPGAFEVHDAAGDSAPPPDGAPSPRVDAAADDASNDSGPLGAACEPGAPEACAPGFTCFEDHTSSTWGCDGVTGCLPDLHGRCFAPCVGELVLDCVTFGGACASIALADGGTASDTLACVKVR
jgi:hypothetical protein